MMSHRKQQIESTLQRTISQALSRRMADPRIRGLVSITRVDASPDLREAMVYVSVLPESDQKRTLAGLQHAAGYIQGMVGRALPLKRMPRLSFRSDETLKKQAAVFQDIAGALE